MVSAEMAVEIVRRDGIIQNIGQLDKLAVRELDRAVKRGEFVKSREPWLGIMAVNKTTWRIA